MAPERLLPKKVVLDRLGCKNTKLYELINSGFLPPPVKLPTPSGQPGRLSYWPESVVSACVEAIAAQRIYDLRRIASAGVGGVFAKK
jgi:predicted DNA-binding transcriptional regulator AlpA